MFEQRLNMLRLAIGEFIGPHAAQSRLCQRWFQIRQVAAVLFSGEGAHPLPDRDQLLGGCQPRRIGAGVPLSLDQLQASHPDHGEFIEIRGGNRQEFQPFQQGNRRGPSLVEDALVEFQPAQFAIKKTSFSSHASHVSFGSADSGPRFRHDPQGRQQLHHVLNDPLLQPSPQANSADPADLMKRKQFLRITNMLDSIGPPTKDGAKTAEVGNSVSLRNSACFSGESCDD